MVKNEEVKRQPTVGKKQHKKIKTEQNVGCSGVVSRSCPTCGILRVAYFRKNTVISPILWVIFWGKRTKL